MQTISPQLIYVATLCRDRQKFKCIQNYGNELCKWYDIDTDETFMVTGLNDKPPELSQHLFKMSTISSARYIGLPYKHEDGHATRQLHCQ